MAYEQDIAVSIESLTHRYGKTVALDHISLSIPNGADVAFIGPDGVGKSTLLGLIGGVRRSQSGSVTVLGGDMAARRHRQQLAAYRLPTARTWPQSLSNVIGGRKHRFLWPTVRAICRRAKRPHLHSPEGDRSQPIPGPAGKLSGGMKQKLGLCCALVRDPTDSGRIDDRRRSALAPSVLGADWIRIRKERPDVTLLTATAYMEEAEHFGRIVAMDEGTILAAGETSDILAQTNSRTLEQAYIAL